MSKHAQRQQGFTLLEIMIALTIFAVISLLAWQILDGAMRTSNATDVAATRLNQLQRAYNLLERDFFQLQARAPRNEPDVFVQSKDGLALTTLNGVSGQVQLERVRWRLKDKTLWRDIWPVIDGPADAEPEKVPILSDIKAMSWRFWKASWLDKWTDTAHQPEGVEVLLTMENGDTWRWVFTTPGDLPIAPAAPAEQSPAAPTDAATPAQAQPTPAPSGENK